MTINTVKERKETPTDASEWLGLEVYTDKATYKLMAHHYNAGQNHKTNVVN
jgi:hypothetical protein